MDLKRCPNGHFYDGEKFPSCPHCQGSGGANETVSFNAEKLDDQDTRTISGESLIAQPPAGGPNENVGPLNNHIGETVSKKQPPADDAKTIGFFGVTPDPVGGQEAVEPVVGWLVCTCGKHKGRDFRLKAGRNFIGRSSTMDVALEGENSVSRESHAIIAYEPRQSIFIAQPGAASELFYLNDNVVLSAVEVKRNDRIQLGDVELMLIPCCDENFKWEKEKRPE